MRHPKLAAKASKIKCQNPDSSETCGIGRDCHIYCYHSTIANTLIAGPVAMTIQPRPHLPHLPHQRSSQFLEQELELLARLIKSWYYVLRIEASLADCPKAGSLANWAERHLMFESAYQRNNQAQYLYNSLNAMKDCTLYPANSLICLHTIFTVKCVSTNLPQSIDLECIPLNICHVGLQNSADCRDVIAQLLNISLDWIMCS
jgi:hypothetical protein